MKRALAIGICCIAIAGCDKIKAMGGGEAGAGSSPSIVGEIFGSDFAGEVTTKMTNAKEPNNPMTLVFGIKKPDYRIDFTGNIPNQQGSLIIDLPTKKGWLLIHPQKMAMMIDLNAQPGQPGHPSFPGVGGGPGGAPAKPANPPKIDKTGKKDTVAGYTCEIWNITSDKERAEACMADNLTWIDISQMGSMSPTLTAGAVLSGADKFPLRVVTYPLPANVEEMRMEAQKIEKKTLDPTRFQPPPDYRKVDMAAMMGGMGMPPGGPGGPPGGPPGGFPNGRPPIPPHR
jgi:hypothetical protein